jgi:hypothetical protein
MIRATLYELLTTDATLTAVVPAERWYERSATTDTPPTPYAVLADLGTDARAAGKFARLYGVYVHDDRGSYTRIDNALSLVRSRLESAAQYLGSDGRLVSATLQSTSDDSFDDATATNTKNSVFRVVGVPNG